MKSTDLGELLQDIYLRPEQREWFTNKDLKTAWNECEDGSLMLYVASAFVTTKQLVRVATEIANLLIPTYEEQYPGDNCMSNCIDAGRKWVNDEMTYEDVLKTREIASETINRHCNEYPWGHITKENGKLALESHFASCAAVNCLTPLVRSKNPFDPVFGCLPNNKSTIDTGLQLIKDNITVDMLESVMINHKIT